jgi:hydroxymethylpyrimidine/phosphomethylpyrimidine kinase
MKERNGKMPRIYRALTIAGSDSGGGAGIQADLKTFQELHVYGMTAITAITVQNTQEVQKTYRLPAQAIMEQMEAVISDIGVDAIKTGMVCDRPIIEEIVAKIRQHAISQVVVDPVMISTNNDTLLHEEAIDTLLQLLLPLATVVTPNLLEAERLTGLQIDSMEVRRQAAQQLIDRGARSVVIKGGHLKTEDVEDLFYDGDTWLSLTSPRFQTRHTHGTGCTFSAAITAYLAKGYPIPAAVKQAKTFVTAAISTPLGLGQGHGPTNHWAHRQKEFQS